MNSSCGACGQLSLVNLGKHPDGHVIRCKQCGCLHLEMLKTTACVSPDDYGQAYRSAFDDLKPQRTFDIFKERVLSQTTVPGTLADIGCGNGEFLELVHREGWHVTGIDSDPQAISLIGKRNLRGIIGHLGAEMPKPEGWDIVTLWDIIEHVIDLEATMRWLSKAVNDGGRIVLLTPNADSVLDSFAHLERKLSIGKSQRLLKLCLNQYHRHRFTPGGLKLLCQRYGFVTEHLSTLQLFSLRPDYYLSGFAPGIPGWTRFLNLNRRLSSLAYAALRIFGIKNKILYIGRRRLRGEKSQKENCNG